ncbi:MAG: molecular chaperone HtpG [Gammaproteobacteria bacterium]|nr:molecular chaperone HtpG [Gammaproteobacteria bacterium]
MTETLDAHKETLKFETEVEQLLQLMIHSLYSNKEIFLRELISNASDACDKLRFEALSDDALFETDPNLHVQVEFNKEKRTITIRDNGIGMNRQEVIDNIGTIARSGTKQFLNKIAGEQGKDINLIGQFGVGFYSSFIVADRVTLTTRRAGLGIEHGVRWESAGQGNYTMETVERAARGTEVVLHLRDGDDEFLDHYRLSQIVRKYSDHIAISVEMPSTEEGKSGEWQKVNAASALWTRAKKDISEEEYNEFYKTVGHDWEDPLAHIHTRVEGNQSYVSLFFVPKRAPFDLWDRERRHGIKLYVRRVFIMDDTEHLMPAYLRFVRGVVDSDDLPLNVSREILQNNRHIDAIRGASVKKVLGLLEDIAKEQPEKYAEFWKEFGRVMKEGPAEDHGNRERIAKLMRFATTHTDVEAQTVSLEDYIARMKPGQDKIYYVTAESFGAAKNSPHLEIFRKKGLEVILLSDRVDEWWVSHITDYEGKTLQSVAKGALDLGDLADAEEKQKQDAAAEEAKDLPERFKKVLGDKVKEVRFSHRLTRSPSCLVVEDQDMAVNLQRMLKAAGHAVPTSNPILELNPTHPLVVKLKGVDDDARFSDWANLLFEQASLAEGGQLDDPAAFVGRMNDLLMTAT